MRNFIRVEEEKAVDDKSRNDNDGNVSSNNEITLKCFKF